MAICAGADPAAEAPAEPCCPRGSTPHPYARYFLRSPSITATFTSNPRAIQDHTHGTINHNNPLTKNRISHSPAQMSPPIALTPTLTALLKTRLRQPPSSRSDVTQAENPRAGHAAGPRHQGGAVRRPELLRLYDHVSPPLDSHDLEAAWARLIFMTYNGWVMLAVSLGAGLGYLVFGGTPVTERLPAH